MDTRAARTGDIPQIAMIHVLSWQEAYRGLMPQEYLDGLDPAQRARTWERVLRQPESSRSGTMVSGGTGAPVGFVNFGPTRDQDEDPDKTGEIRAIYVLPGAWGQGHGRDLMAALGRLAAAGFERATLWVLDTNARARRFYEAGGWSADGTRRTEEMEGLQLTEVRYRRPLP